MKIPCHDCTVGDWGACHHPEYGTCMYANHKNIVMTETFTKKELQNFNAFKLWSLAEQYKVVNFEHLAQYDLIEAILEKQQESITNLI